MERWRTYFWGLRVSRIEGRTRSGVPNADALTIIACLARWRKWTARLAAWLGKGRAGQGAGQRQKSKFKSDAKNEYVNVLDKETAICDWAIKLFGYTHKYTLTRTHTHTHIPEPLLPLCYHSNIFFVVILHNISLNIQYYSVNLIYFFEILYRQNL